MKPTELKPCPFCGGEAKLIVWDRLVFNEYRVECTQCGMRTPSTMGDPKSEVKLWNRRANDEQAD